MARQESVQVQGERRHRDEELRAAHRRAFEQIRVARTRRNRALIVQQAVDQLIEACEAYVWGRDPHAKAS